jgi:hypothetical protein
MVALISGVGMVAEHRDVTKRVGSGDVKDAIANGYTLFSVSWDQLCATRATRSEALVGVKL